MLLENYMQCGKIVNAMEKYSMDADMVIECMKFRRLCDLKMVSSKEILEILDQKIEKPEGKTEDQKTGILEELDGTIKSICKEIRNLEGNNRFGTDAELVKALADLVEVRSCLPDWKEKHTPE